MQETLQNFLLTLALAVLCGIAASLVRSNKQRLLLYTEALIQRAETAIQGSGLGAEKKAAVIAQLEAAGVGVTEWLSDQIDTIVSELNSRSAWLAQKAQTQVKSVTEEAHGDGR